jgi:hypothetical protein
MPLQNENENEREAIQVTEITAENEEIVGGTERAIEPDEGGIAEETH